MKDLLRLLVLMRPQAGWMALAVLLSAITSLSHAGLMAASGWFITAMALAGAAGATMNPFTASAAIRAFALLRTAGRYGERIIGHEATLKFVARLRPWFFARLVPLAPAALEDQRSGDLLARLKNDIDRLEFAFLRVLSPLVAALLAVIVVVGFAAAYDATIALAFAGLLAVAGIGLPLLAHRIGAGPSRRLARDTGVFEAVLVDHLEGRAELDIYDPENRHRLQLDAASDALFADEGRLAGLAAATAAGVGLCAQLALLAVVLLGAPLVLAGQLAGANLPMLALLALAAFDAVAPLPLALQTLPGTLESARRLFALVDRRPPVPEQGAFRPVPTSGALIFSQVSLTYPGASRPALREVDLTLAPGRHVAVVGPSGSGKSSLVALALRFRAADAGTITFAGTSVDAFAPDALRRRIAVLAQRDHLFAETLIDNLRIADPQASVAACEQACATAAILPFVEAQPEGFETFVGAHGAGLSGGEARRLSLARALMKDAPILILDEPTEGLDPQTERAVMDAVLDAARDRAVLLITHRLAGLERMDEILVLDEGCVVARGVSADILSTAVLPTA